MVEKLNSQAGLSQHSVMVVVTKVSACLNLSVPTHDGQQ